MAATILMIFLIFLGSKNAIWDSTFWLKMWTGDGDP